uniref:Putative secreted protein n=1 Tax=Anopheles darlingi TaxID=43151 RepID=A0A2M4DR79_ANODA
MHNLFALIQLALHDVCCCGQSLTTQSHETAGWRIELVETPIQNPPSSIKSHRPTDHMVGRSSTAPHVNA